VEPSLSSPVAGFVFTRHGWVQLWLLRARPIAARVSTSRETKAAHYKEETDPCSGNAHSCRRVHQRRRRPKGRLHNRTGEDNADEHLKRQIMGRGVVIAVTNGRLDFGTWERIFYGEFDGRRRKRVLVKIIGEVRPVRPKLGQSA
jgi:secondary thiamine-phosphate synthase enzyme